MPPAGQVASLAGGLKMIQEAQMTSRRIGNAAMAAAVLLCAPALAAEEGARVWEKVEIVLRAHNKYANPCKDVEVYVDLQGPGFRKRCYGFWDGGRTFRVRVLATKPGTWRWRSGSSPSDPGLAGVTGEFQAKA